MLWAIAEPDNPGRPTRGNRIHARRTATGYSPAMPISLRDKIAENSQQFLQPGEQVQAVIGGQTLSGWWGALTYLVFFFNKYRAIVATDRRILVLHCGKWRMGSPKSVVRELPRNTKIGPATGLWYKSESLGEKMYIHKRFHKDVAAADAAAMT
jgi:hypothetical protein